MRKVTRMFAKQTETAGDTAGRPPGEPAGTGPGLAAGRAPDRAPGVAAGRLIRKFVHRPTNNTRGFKKLLCQLENSKIKHC